MSELWTADDVCAWLAAQGRPMKPRSWHSAASRGWAPPSDDRIGRTPVWHPETVKAWHADRPGRTGRPRKTPDAPDPRRSR